jgi:hypothetical protein
MKTGLGTIALTFAVAISASAQVPLKKASDIVHAFVQTGQACPGPPGSEDRFSDRILADGTTVPLVIPNKRVLIIRHIEIATGGQTPGATGLVSLLTGPEGNLALHATREVTLTPSGSARYQIDLPIGIPVAAGGVVCIHNTMGVEFGGTIEGYFAPAK